MKRVHYQAVDAMARFYERRIKWVDRAITLTFAILAFITLSQIWGMLKVAAFDLSANAKSNFGPLSDQLAILIYAFSWINGSLKDVALQRKAFTLITDKEQIEKIGNILAPILCFLGVGLLIALKYGNRVTFWTTLLVFVVADLRGWVWLMRNGLNETYINSRSSILHEKDGIRIRDFLQLEVVRNYVAGPWKNTRYAVMIGVTLVGLVLSIKPEVYKKLCNVFAFPDYLCAAAPLWIYLIIAEAWMWIFRLRAWFCVDKLDEVFASKEILKILELSYGGKPAKGSKPSS